jgi:hypothetical protein
MAQKGQLALDIITFSVMLLVVALSVTMSYIIMKEYKTATDLVFTEPVALNLTAKAVSFYAIWDSAFIFLVMGMGVALFISVFYIRTHPAFFFVTLITLVLGMILIPQISNIFNAYETSDGMAKYNLTTNFPTMTYVMNNLPFIMAILGIVTLTLLFIRPYIFGDGNNVQY